MALVELEKNNNAERLTALQQWFWGLLPELKELGLVNSSLGLLNVELKPVSGDASFRRYFRAANDQHSFILVDAPPDKENSRPFVDVAEKFRSIGINVPIVHKVDYDAGFMCLSDFGDTLLWEKLAAAQQDDKARTGARELYQQAFFQLLKIQACEIDSEFSLPLFDKAMLQREMTLFKQWFCEGILGLSFSTQESAMLANSFDFLIDSAQAQKQVCVHRDYHSRNLLFQEQQELGVIDFQDAVLGPFSYDLVSLLKDCYISWPRKQVNQWALDYARLAYSENIINELDEGSFLKSFDLMGVQRHLKAVGIFSRLYLRDKRLPYLADIPRTLEYIKDVAKEQEELTAFSEWLGQKVLPQVNEKIKAILLKAEQS